MRQRWSFSFVCNWQWENRRKKRSDREDRFNLPPFRLFFLARTYTRSFCSRCSCSHSRWFVARGLVGVRVHAREIPDKRAGVPRFKRISFLRRKRGRAFEVVGGVGGFSFFCSGFAWIAARCHAGTRASSLTTRERVNDRDFLWSTWYFVNERDQTNEIFQVFRYFKIPFIGKLQAEAASWHKNKLSKCVKC